MLELPAFFNISGRPNPYNPLSFFLFGENIFFAHFNVGLCSCEIFALPDHAFAGIVNTSPADKGWTDALVRKII